MEKGKCIIWFRRDLRIQDNPAIDYALENDLKIVPVYIFDPAYEGAWPLGSASRSWLYHSLSSLADSLRKHRTNLIIQSGNSLDSLLKLSTQTGATHVLWNRRYEPDVLKNDSRTKEVLKSKAITTKTFNSHLLLEPDRLENKSGKPFQVFTPFWKAHQHAFSLPALNDRTKHLNSDSFFQDEGLNSLNVSLESLHLKPETPWDARFYETFRPGEQGAKEKLDTFAASQRLITYDNDRNIPAIDGTSRLSPHLAFGEISPHRIAATLQNSCGFGERGAAVFMSELGWREFAYHLLFHFPTTTTQPLKPAFVHFPWEHNNQKLEEWKSGTLGIPIVDAGMRELWHTGWMHNRVRMLVGSFLVKNLLIPWQEGARWFWDTLVDADLASNTMGWQWVAGSGADAAPYFRIFNPILQSQKFDSKGDYIKQWIPSLRIFDPTSIHTPWRDPLTLSQTDYPELTTSLIESRARALEAYNSIKIAS